MLSRNEDGRHFDRATLVVPDGHLGLAVGPEPAFPAGFAVLGHSAREPMGQQNGKGHELGSFVGRKAKHDPLVAGTLLGRVHPLGDFLGLTAQEGPDLDRPGAEGLGLVDVADVLDGLAGDGHVVGVGCGRDFAGQDDVAVFAENLASDMAVGILLQTGVQNGVGDRVADLVRMPFADGFRGKFVRGHDAFPFAPIGRNSLRIRS
jgi:hypothetical protein